MPGRSRGLLPLYLNQEEFHKLERIGMILFLPLGPRTCSVDKNTRSVDRIAKLRTVTEASAEANSLHEQGWRSASLLQYQYNHGGRYEQASNVCRS